MTPALVTPPVWIDLGAGDTAAEQAFYGAIFGWDFPAQHPDAGGWRPAVVRDAMAAGMSPRPEGMPMSFWTVFFGTSDIEAAIARSLELGANPMMPAMPVVIDGVLMTTIALMVDPGGAVFGLAQQGANPGITHAGHGSAGWYELMSSDVAGARSFYCELLGITAHPEPRVLPLDYATLRGPDGDFAGTMGMFEGAPEGIPSAWSVYFMVDDVDATLAIALANGATLMMGPETMHAGRIAYLADPEGAPFGLLTPAAPE